MKKITRILSVALVAVMLLSVSAVSFAADDTTAYIPARLAKLGLDIDIEDIQYPELSINITALDKRVVKIENGKPVYQQVKPDYCPKPDGTGYDAKLITEDSVAQYQFTEKPDWFGVVLSSLDGGWSNIEIDDDGYGEFEIGELHRQPGMWSWYNNPTSHGSGGDYPYSGGKNYGDYSVNVNYHRDGSAYKVAITFAEPVDPFLTGMEGGVLTVTYEAVEPITDCYKKALAQWTKDKAEKKYYPKPTSDAVWYLSNVSVKYPEGNYIVGIDTGWRNDKKQNLATYKVTYAVSENAYYRITYAPQTTSIYENHTDKKLDGTATYTVKYKDGDNEKTYVYKVPERFNDLGKQQSSAAYYPSKKLDDGNYIHHYTADQPLSGEFFKSRADWEANSVYAVSGSNAKGALKNWYEFFGTDKVKSSKSGVEFKANKLGKKVKNIKKACTSFKSPRRLTK